LAAESHVDRSIDSAGEVIPNNIVGPVNLLGGTPARARLHLSQVFVEIR